MQCSLNKKSIYCSKCLYKHLTEKILLLLLILFQNCHFILKFNIKQSKYVCY